MLIEKNIIKIISQNIQEGVILWEQAIIRITKSPHQFDILITSTFLKTQKDNNKRNIIIYSRYKIELN